MIFKERVRQVALQYLKLRTDKAPSVQKYLLRRELFGKWVDLAHIRVNEIDLAGYCTSKAALELFIRQACEAFICRQLEKVKTQIPT